MTGNHITRRRFVRVCAGGALIAIATDQSGGMDRPPETSEFAFGVIADVQYCDAEPSGTRYYRASKEKLSQCVTSLNEVDLAFVIHLGDLIDRDAESFDAIVPVFNRLRPPRYHVLGNHDFSVAADRLNDVPGMLGMRDRYYSFSAHGWRFVVLDGNDLSLVARPKGSPEYEVAAALHATLKGGNAANAQTWNGGAGKSQLAWLEQELAGADKARERVIVFCHFPVWPRDAHNLWNDSEVLGILESRACVAAFMNGHNHAGNYAQKDGIHFVTFPGMVETRDTTAFAVVHVHRDEVQVAGFGRTPSRRLKLRP